MLRGVWVVTAVASGLLALSETPAASASGARISAETPQADISVTLVSLPRSIRVGARAVITLAVTNHGPATVTPVLKLDVRRAEDVTFPDSASGCIRLVAPRKEGDDPHDAFWLPGLCQLPTLTAGSTQNVVLAVTAKTTMLRWGLPSRSIVVRPRVCDGGIPVHCRDFEDRIAFMDPRPGNNEVKEGAMTVPVVAPEVALPDPCSLLRTTDAAKVLGDPSLTVQRGSRSAERDCRYTSKRLGAARMLALTISAFAPSPAEFAAAHARMQRVRGIGSAAYWGRFNGEVLDVLYRGRVFRFHVRDSRCERVCRPKTTPLARILPVARAALRRL